MPRKGLAALDQAAPLDLLRRPTTTQRTSTLMKGQPPHRLQRLPTPSIGQPLLPCVMREHALISPAVTSPKHLASPNACARSTDQRRAPSGMRSCSSGPTERPPFAVDVLQRKPRAHIQLERQPLGHAEDAFSIGVSPLRSDAFPLD